MTSVSNVRTDIIPQCGNGFCEVHEADRSRPELCLADCSSLGWCPVALSGLLVGKEGSVCGDIGVCKPTSRQCSCPVGHTGEACTGCEFGFVPRGVLPLSPWSVPIASQLGFQKLASDSGELCAEASLSTSLWAASPCT
jgi:hypothetical protein